jgi:hypothetical protein
MASTSAIPLRDTTLVLANDEQREVATGQAVINWHIPKGIDLEVGYRASPIDSMTSSQIRMVETTAWHEERSDRQWFTGWTRRKMSLLVSWTTDSVGARS